VECNLDDDQLSQACTDYNGKLQELSAVLDQAKSHHGSLKTLADELANIKLQVSKSKPAPDSPQLKAALQNAKKISKEQGASSPDARIAWETVEEIASAGLQNSLGGKLNDDECAIVESALEACKALEELNKALSSSQQTKGL
jgi:hypothetical protein